MPFHKYEAENFGLKNMRLNFMHTCKIIKYTYSFNEHLHFRLHKVWTKLSKSRFEFIMRNNAIVVSVHHPKHLFYVFNFFVRQVISNNLFKITKIKIYTNVRKSYIFKPDNVVQRTLNAFLLNLFILENCFSLDLTTSPSGTFGAFLAFWSQGCSARICVHKHQFNIYVQKRRLHLKLVDKSRTSR